MWYRTLFEPPDSKIIISPLQCHVAVRPRVARELKYYHCGEMTSPSPLKSLHKLVRLLGWTSPFSHVLGKPKRQSQYVIGCHCEQTC